MSFVPAAGCPEVGGLRILPERLLQATLHGVHLHPLVPSPGVSPHRRLLHLQNGPVERWLRVLRDCQVELRPASCPRASRPMSRSGPPGKARPTHRVASGQALPLPDRLHRRPADGTISRDRKHTRLSFSFSSNTCPVRT